MDDGASRGGAAPPPSSGAQGVGTAPTAGEPGNPWAGMSVKALKAELTSAGISTVGIVEKREMIELLAARAAPVEENEELTCAICFESTDLVALPCCAREETSTTRFCLRCVELLCEHAGGVGRCPKCRAWIAVRDGRVVRSERIAQCVMCRQRRTIVDRDRCDACLLGDRHCLRYECARCHLAQRIPHPMWRYQDSPTAFGAETWACHQRCGTYTNWRVLAADAHLVPAHDAPESWGREDEWLERVRAIRRAELSSPRRAPQRRRRDPMPPAGQILPIYIVGGMVMVSFAFAITQAALIGLTGRDWFAGWTGYVPGW